MRTLSADRAKAFITRLSDFDDVEVEERAHAYAACHPDFQRGLQLLMDWPALPEAARMIQARPEEAAVVVSQAELLGGSAPSVAESSPPATGSLKRRT